MCHTVLVLFIARFSSIYYSIYSTCTSWSLTTPLYRTFTCVG